MVADAVRIIDNYIKVSLPPQLLALTLVQKNIRVSPVRDTNTLPHQCKVFCLGGHLFSSSSALAGFTQRALHVWKCLR